MERRSEGIPPTLLVLIGNNLLRPLHTSHAPGVTEASGGGMFCPSPPSMLQGCNKERRCSLYIIIYLPCVFLQLMFSLCKKEFSFFLTKCESVKDFASSGNRTRAARVAGEHSTTEPTMLHVMISGLSNNYITINYKNFSVFFIPPMNLFRNKILLWAHIVAVLLA